jgi:hypothetical protein
MPRSALPERLERCSLERKRELDISIATLGGSVKQGGIKNILHPLYNK